MYKNVKHGSACSNQRKPQKTVGTIITIIIGECNNKCHKWYSNKILCFLII